MTTTDAQTRPVPFKDRTSFSAEEISHCIAGLGEWKKRPRLPGGYLRMIDHITTLSRTDGVHKKGYARARRMLHPHDQVFKDHFRDDPVFPGSFELEMIAQLGGFLGGWYENLLGRGRAVGLKDLRWIQEILPDYSHLLECGVDLFSLEETKKGKVATFDGWVRSDGGVVCKAKRVQTIILPLAA